MQKAVDDYLELRRGLGFKLRDYDACLRELVSFLESNGSFRITSKLALEFATQHQDQKPVAWARRMTIARGFASYRSGADPSTELPNWDSGNDLVDSLRLADTTDDSYSLVEMQGGAVANNLAFIE